MIDGGPPAVEKRDPEGAQLREVIIEFGRHLDMLAEQLGGALSEADRECHCVGASFHEMALAKKTIEGIDCAEPEGSVLRDSCKQIGESLHTAVVALQYHDRLSQRLALIRAALTRLQMLLHDRSPGSYDDWLHALRDVERVSRTEQQRLGPNTSRGQPGSAQRGAMSPSSVELF